MEKKYQHIFNLIPDTIDYNFIPVKNESVRSFCLDNISDVSVYFLIDHTEFYVFEPNNGVVTKNNKLEIKIKINPDAAQVIVANARITLDNKVSKVIKMSSISKYPYLKISKESLDFGIVQIGKSSQEELVLTNPESVPTKFSIIRQSSQPGKHPEIFFLSDLSGEIPPHSSFLIKIKFKTVFPGIQSYETYLIKTIGGNQLRFSCSGSCSSLKTWLGAKCVNFKSIPLGSQFTKQIRIYNDSDQATEYQMYYMNSGAFTINKTQGIIPGKSNIRIHVTFKPYETTIYYERVFCLTKNHFLTVLDLYGSSEDLLNKPRILEQRNIDIFRFKLLNGFYFGKMMLGKENEIIDKLNRTISNKSSLEEKTSEDALIAFTNQTQLHKEMFWEQTSPNRIISCDAEHVDFNFVGEGLLSEPYKIHVQNNSNEKVKVKWILDKEVNLSNLTQGANIFNNPNTIFFVQPEECIINKMGQVEFKVFFKPNRSEYYFYSDLPCQATIMTNYNTNTSGGVPPVQSNKLTQAGLQMTNLTQSCQIKSPNKTTKSSLLYKNRSLMKSLNAKPQVYEYFDPPVPLKLSMVGHSFPPGTQLFMPIYSMTPNKELFFPSVSINQSIYQTLKIQNNSDTPLFYKISTDPLGVFRVFRKYGLIEANEFHLICVEFCPKDCTVYRFPMRIIFNHDTQNMKTVILNALCTDPVIEIEGVRNEVYFPPTYVGIKTKKKITIKNLSPIRLNVQISMEKNPNAVVEVKPCYFEMDSNFVKTIEIAMIPTRTEEIICPINFNVERIYDPSSESIGIFNPGSFTIKTQGLPLDKRCFKRELILLGRGSDGDLSIDPIQLDFGTVKVGFHKKLSFFITNPTITNFYIKLVTELDDVSKGTILNDNDKKEILSFDFKQGLINSFCKKEINVIFRPQTRSSINMNVYVYASNNITSLNTQLNKSAISIDKEQTNKVQTDSQEFDNSKTLKCQLRLKANGDYPLIKIVDLRNSTTGTCTLWKNFSISESNTKLQEKLSEEEWSYVANNFTNNKAQDSQEKLKRIKCDFGKHLLRGSLNQKKGKQSFDIYVTLKNEGGVTSEFYFKFPDDAAIKREIWMDPVEPTSADKIEYHVLKEKIFEIEPRKTKLEPNECCNIRFRYNIKEIGEHHLRVIYQILNGKPLILELSAESYLEKEGVLEIPKPILDFSYVPIGCMSHIASSMELANVGGSKIKYHIGSEEIDKFNLENEDVNVLKVENLDGVLGPEDSKYISAYFRPIEHKLYELNLTVYYTYDDTNIYQKPITIRGFGYHPYNFTPPKCLSPYEGMSTYCLWNSFNGEMIQKCGLNIQEIDFGEINDKPVNKTIILYNYSMSNSFEYEFPEPGFMLKDELKVTPNKGIMEPNSHKYIKMCLTPKKLITIYEGELGIKITWNATPTKDVEKEMLYIRILKKTYLKDISGLIELSKNNNCSFVENLLQDLTKEIICSKGFDDLITENLENQPLTLYDWTNDKSYPEQQEVRTKIMDGYIRAAGILQETAQMSPMKRNHSKVLTNPPKMQNKLSNEKYDEIEDIAIQEKYLNEIMNKYQMTLPEMNEKILMVNQDSRNVISDVIMENTIFNILSEAVYGETDLTEKVRIYFFANKAQPQQVISQSQQIQTSIMKKDSEKAMDTELEIEKDKDKEKPTEIEKAVEIAKDLDKEKENLRYLK